MKLLVVTQYFAPEEFRINDLVAGMVARGHEVTVLTGQPNYPSGQFFEGHGWTGPRHEERFGARVIRVPLIPRGSASGARLALNYLSFVVTGCWGVLTRLRGPFDAIFVFEVSPATVGIPAVLAKWRFRIPLFFWVLDLWPETLEATGAVKSRRLIRMVGSMVSWIYRHCDRVLVSSRAFAPAVQAAGAKPESIRYFPNWVEDVYQAPRSVSLPQLPPGFIILFAGNLGESQDLPAILEAASLCRELEGVHWVFAGDGRRCEWAKEETKRLGLEANVHFLGRLDSAKMPALFAQAGALLVSLKANPTFSRTVPGKVQSYLTAGKPILAMLDGEGARVVQEAGSGLACGSGDSRALARHVQALLSMDEETRRQWGQAGQHYAKKNFHRATLLDSLDAWINELVKPEKNAH